MIRDKPISQQQNRNSKMEEVNQKINDFDLKLNVVGERKPIQINNHHKRPSTPKEKESLIIKEKERISIEKKRESVSDEKEGILDEFIRYNLNKKIINEKLLEKPNIRMVERSPMIVPKNIHLKNTNDFIKDNLKSSEFFKDVL